MFEDYDSYRRPMAEFLNLFAKKNRNPGPERLAEFETRFQETISTAHQALGRRAFRPQTAINVAIYEAVMVAIARRLEEAPITDPKSLKAAYTSLLADNLFQEATSRATADNAAVATRLERATKFISKAK